MLACSVVCLSKSYANSDFNIVVKGLFKNNALVIIDGKQRLLKKGKTSPEGITLISANSKQAQIRYNDKVHTLLLSKGVGASYTEPTVNEIRLQRGDNGHYFTPGTINGRQTSFLVDTGASSIAMSSADADGLGLSYKDARKVKVNTASGVSDAFEVKLRSVAIGSVKVSNVDALIIEGVYPITILLGNSFLSQVEMKVEEGVLILQKPF